MQLEGRISRQQQRCEDTGIVHRNEESVNTKLHRIAEKASQDKRCQFTSLFHLMNRELLLECFTQLKGKAASGIDKMTKEQYGNNIEANVENLVERLHKMSYRPQPVLRIYIPKPGSDKQRPLGIPTLEDKLVQAGLVKILGAIYEQDFIDDSYGFRPARSCHDALRSLSQTVEGKPIHYIVEADIKGFFDNVDQEQLMKFIAHRIADKHILRYIKRFLKAGISEDGQHKASERGTPRSRTGTLEKVLFFFSEFFLKFQNVEIEIKSGIFLKKIRKSSRLGEFKLSEVLNRFEFNKRVGNGMNLSCCGLNQYPESKNFGIKSVNDNAFQS